MKKKTALLIYLIIFVSCLFPDTIVLGSEDQWTSLYSMENTRTLPGKMSYEDVTLESFSYSVDEDTQLLLSFEATSMDLSGRFSILSGERPPVSEAAVGDGSLRFIEVEPLILESNSFNLFSPGNDPKSFSIDFWLYPIQTGEGETVFLWQGTAFRNNSVLPQEIRCGIHQRRLQWQFNQFFLHPELRSEPITLESLFPLVPEQWSHHEISYSAEINQIIYLVDGIPNAIAHLTSDGTETGEPFLPFVGSASDSIIRIGDQYNGLLDEFRITTDISPEVNFHRGYHSSGNILTDVLSLGTTNACVETISLDKTIPEGTTLYLYYRISDTFFLPSSENIPFVPWNPDSAEHLRSGQFLQLLIEFLPEGTKTKSPLLHQIEIEYKPDYPPLPPQRIFCVPGDESVEIEWSRVNEEDLAGYLLYFGTAPGMYSGRTSNGTTSPVNVGNTNSYVIEGLENKQIYYFSLVSYDYSRPPHLSDFSSESFARPGSFFND